MSFCGEQSQGSRGGGGGGFQGWFTYFISHPNSWIRYSVKCTISLIGLCYGNDLATQARQLEVIGIIGIYYGNLHFYSRQHGTHHPDWECAIWIWVELALQCNTHFRPHRVSPSFVHRRSLGLLLRCESHQPIRGEHTKYSLGIRTASFSSSGAWGKICRLEGALGLWSVPW